MLNLGLEHLIGRPDSIVSENLCLLLLSSVSEGRLTHSLRWVSNDGCTWFNLLIWLRVFLFLSDLEPWFRLSWQLLHQGFIRDEDFSVDFGCRDAMQDFSASFVQIRFPDDDVSILTTCQDEVTEWGELSTIGRALVTIYCVHDLSFAKVPDLDSGII